MKILHEEINGKIVPVGAQIESEEEIEFLLDQLRPKSKWILNTMLMQFVCERCGQIPIGSDKELFASIYYGNGLASRRIRDLKKTGKSYAKELNTIFKGLKAGGSDNG